MKDRSSKFPNTREYNEKKRSVYLDTSESSNQPDEALQEVRSENMHAIKKRV